MDIPVLIATLILAAIAAAEVILLLRCPKVTAFPLTLFIRSDSPDFPDKLRYAAFLLTTQEQNVQKIIIFQKSSNELQKALCARFTAEFPDNVLIVSEKNENFLQKIIDFTDEI